MRIEDIYKSYRSYESFTGSSHGIAYREFSEKLNNPYSNEWVYQKDTRCDWFRQVKKKHSK